jgi:hypothetical protein
MAKLPVLRFLGVILFPVCLVCYNVEHQGHSYYKSKKVLDINSTPMKSSVYVNGVSNRRGVWRHDYEFVVVCS